MNEAQEKSLKLAKAWLDNISDVDFIKEYFEIVLQEKNNTIKFQNEYIMQLSKEKCALQAKIDELMLEFHCRRVPVSEAQSPSRDQECPKEMTTEQIERWEESQVVSTHPTKDNLCL